MLLVTLRRGLPKGCPAGLEGLGRARCSTNQRRCILPDDWRAFLSKEAHRLWVFLQAAQMGQTTLKDMARACQTSKTAVKRALVELEEHGFLAIMGDEV